jgi:methanogenic corrinoid protein MtbC1
MVYIRAKKVKSDQYLYLVKSVWDSKKKTSKQEIVKYLGKSSDVVNDDIPIDYRNNLKILSAIAKYNPKNIKNNEVATKKIKEKLYKKLTEGDIQESIKIYQEYIKNFDFANFFDEVLKPVMYKIGEDWVNEKISIATEHIASNTAQILVRTIMEQVSGNTKKKKILICVPIGEEHRLGCDVLETYLLSKGFKIYNMGTSIPTVSILSFIENNKPDVVFLSITLKDNLKAGQRLVKKIKEQSEIPILVGGFAIQEEMALKFDARVISDVKLDEIPKILKSI